MKFKSKLLLSLKFEKLGINISFLAFAFLQTYELLWNSSTRRRKGNSEKIWDGELQERNFYSVLFCRMTLFFKRILILLYISWLYNKTILCSTSTFRFFFEAKDFFWKALIYFN